MRRFGAIVRKCVLQLVRDPFGLALTLLTPTLFVGLYWLVFDADSARPSLVVVAEDPEIRSALADPLLPARVRFVDDEAELRRCLLASGGDSLGLVFDDAGIATARGDFADAGVALMVEGLLRRLDNPAAPPVTSSTARSPFDRYVPGLIVFAVIMLVFSASMAVSREIERGGLIRLRLTSVRPIEVVGGTSLVQFGVGLATVSLTLLVALALGFQSAGAWQWVVLLAAIGCLSSIGVGMIIASSSSSAARAFLVSSVAMFLLMLFSGVVFPRPRVDLWTIGSRTVGLFDILPTTHLHVGLAKVTRLGATGGEIVYEFAALTMLSFGTFAIGIWLFGRTQRLGVRR